MGLQGDFGRVTILRPRAVEWRFAVNDGREWDCGNCLPKDFRELPKALRRQVPLDEIRSFLPEPYRLLGDDLLTELLVGNVPSLPSAILAGGIKFAWLFTASGTFTVPPDWNGRDNVVHAVGKGGTGRAPTSSPLLGGYYGGPGGGGAAWAAIDDSDYAVGDIKPVTVAVSSGDTSFDSTSVLLAKSGANGGTISSGSGPGGQGGQASSSVGNRKYSGGDGAGVSGAASAVIGGQGGGAAGPHGDGGTSLAVGDAGYGGTFDYDLPGGDGVDGPAGGWNPGGNVNAGSGAGGGQGSSSSGDGASADGKDGGKYGGGSGGGGVRISGTQQIGSPGTPAQGCVLVVNNASA